MKKKILFILLLLIPFMVKANPAERLNEKWRFEDEKEDYIYYDFNNTFVFSSGEKLISIDKITGEEKTVEYQYGFHAANEKKNTVTLIQQEDNKISIIVYNEYLKELKRETIEYFEIDNIKPIITKRDDGI
mgnify:CR=1 FL=1